MNFLNKKILFTTPVGNIPDYFEYSVSQKMSFSLPTPSFGLRFIKENIPHINIIEYPDWNEFANHIKNTDILGISFFMKDIPVVDKMIRIARDAGVKEIWGGNYGVLCSEFNNKFDRIFTDYSEHELYELIYDKSIDMIKHPVLDTTIGISNFPLRIKYGFLFTSRGCKYKCSFCQTPSFVKHTSFLDLKEVSSILDIYKSMNINFLFIMDENFNVNSENSNKIIKMLRDKEFTWGIMTRYDNLEGNVSLLKESGMVDVIIGIESDSDIILKSLNKKTDIRKLETVLEELYCNNIYVHGCFMIGYESENKNDIYRSFFKLKNMQIDSMQITVITPFPSTRLYDHIKLHYGVSENYNDYDVKYLCWNHPLITSEEMKTIIHHGKMLLNTKTRLIKGLYKLFKNSLFWKNSITWHSDKFMKRRGIDFEK